MKMANMKGNKEVGIQLKEDFCRNNRIYPALIDNDRIIQ